jgi:hypothetical protein
MKKMVFLCAVAFVATLVLSTTATAQVVVPKAKIMTIACKGEAEACFNLDFQQKMATTGGNVSTAKPQASTGASTTANNPVTARRANAVGGVENNPAEDGAGSIQLTLNKNAERQQNGMAKAKTTKGAAVTANNPVTRKRTDAIGGVENNPAEDGNGSTLLTLRKNADRQREVMPAARNGHSARSAQSGHHRSQVAPRGGDPTDNNPMAERAAAQPRSSSAERAMNSWRPSVLESKAHRAIHARETYRHNPSDF